MLDLEFQVACSAAQRGTAPNRPECALLDTTALVAPRIRQSGGVIPVDTALETLASCWSVRLVNTPLI